MFLTYKYRLLPTKRQHRALEDILESQRQLYNAALEERIDYYRKTGRSRSYLDQQKELTICRRELPEMGSLCLKIQRWTLSRLDKAYIAFFTRVKAKKKVKFPRYRGFGWWDSFGFAEFRGIRWDGKRLRFKGLKGGLRVHLHRPLPKSQNIRACVFKRDAKGWCVYFQLFVQECRKKTISTSPIGIDLGLKVFSYASDGVIVPNPKIARKVEKKLRVYNRALARCNSGSKRRLKIKARLVKVHQKIADTRKTWLHQQSCALINRADLIVTEDLNIQIMKQNLKFSKAIHDVSWSTFLYMVAYKAERAGKRFIKVNPKNTSQKCSGCQELVPKSLAVRTHSCPHCGLTMDRDHNAAKNILQAVVGLEQHNVIQLDKRAAMNLRLTSESLTSRGTQ